MESTNIRVKLNSVEQVRQFVETMRKYDGDVDVYSSNRNYLVDNQYWEFSVLDLIRNSQ